APSRRRYLHGQVKDLDCSPGPRGLEALKFAIYYAAVTTLTAEQCMTQVGEERSVLLAKYRLSVEAALARADMINTVEISTLQALVIFLVGLLFPSPLPPNLTSLNLSRLQFAVTIPLGLLGQS